MNFTEQFSCPWLERVSAFIDGELQEAQCELVESHARSCTKCKPLLDNQTILRSFSQVRPSNIPLAPVIFRQRNTPLLRVLLAIIGVMIILGSGPEFIRGNTSGNNFHDLRHLSIWQIAIGIGALSAAISFRISRLMAVIISTFLLLTAIATIYDLVTHHRGPWTDPLHVVEIAAVLVIMRMIFPHIRLSKIRLKPLARSH